MTPSGNQGQEARGCSWRPRQIFLTPITFLTTYLCFFHCHTAWSPAGPQPNPPSCPASPSLFFIGNEEDVEWTAHQYDLAWMLSCFSHVWLFATPWVVAGQAPLSTGFSRQEYWSGLHALLQGISPTQGSNARLLHLLHYRQILYHWASREAHSLSYTFSLGEGPSLA